MHRARVGLVLVRRRNVSNSNDIHMHGRIVRIDNTHGLNLGLGYHMQALLEEPHKCTWNNKLTLARKRKKNDTKEAKNINKKLQWKYNSYIFSDDYFAI